MYFHNDVLTSLFKLPELVFKVGRNIFQLPGQEISLFGESGHLIHQLVSGQAKTRGEVAGWGVAKLGSGRWENGKMGNGRKREWQEHG